MLHSYFYYIFHQSQYVYVLHVANESVVTMLETNEERLKLKQHGKAESRILFKKSGVSYKRTSHEACLAALHYVQHLSARLAVACVYPFSATLQPIPPATPFYLPATPSHHSRFKWVKTRGKCPIETFGNI